MRTRAARLASAAALFAVAALVPALWLHARPRDAHVAASIDAVVWALLVAPAVYALAPEIGAQPHIVVIAFLVFMLDSLAAMHDILRWVGLPLCASRYLGGLTCSEGSSLLSGIGLVADIVTLYQVSAGSPRLGTAIASSVAFAGCLPWGDRPADAASALACASGLTLAATGVVSARAAAHLAAAFVAFAAVHRLNAPVDSRNFCLEDEERASATDHPCVLDADAMLNERGKQARGWIYGTAEVRGQIALQLLHVVIVLSWVSLAQASAAPAGSSVPATLRALPLDSNTLMVVGAFIVGVATNVLHTRTQFTATPAQYQMPDVIA